MAGHTRRYSFRFRILLRFELRKKSQLLVNLLRKCFFRKTGLRFFSLFFSFFLLSRDFSDTQIRRHTQSNMSRNPAERNQLASCF